MRVDQVTAEVSLARQILASGPFQLLAHVLLTSLPSTIFWLVWRTGEYEVVNFQNTLVALTLGACLGWFVMMRLRSYAKARLLSYVLPVNFVIFASILAVIAIFRVEYSVYLFVFGSLSAVTSSFAFAAITRNSLRLQFVVRGGRTSEIALDGNYVPAMDIQSLDAMLQGNRFDGAIIADLHHNHSDDWERLFAKAALAGVPVYHYRHVAEMQFGQVKIDHLAENDLGSLIPNVPYMTTKRAIDIIGSLVLLPVLLMSFVLIGILIKLDSRGKVFFVQERIGFRGKNFRMIKFRTMQQRSAIERDDVQRDDAMTKVEDDRITRIGHFLRKTRIDELPQVLNILRGEMSWIGPRPEALALSKWYEGELPFYSYRHIVRPGISGWAQVNQGHVTDVSDVNSKLRFDFYYVKNISLWLDLLVVFKTIRVILTGYGAK